MGRVPIPASRGCADAQRPRGHRPPPPRRRFARLGDPQVESESTSGTGAAASGARALSRRSSRYAREPAAALEGRSVRTGPHSERQRLPPLPPLFQEPTDHRFLLLAEKRAEPQQWRVKSSLVVGKATAGSPGTAAISGKRRGVFSRRGLKTAAA